MSVRLCDRISNALLERAPTLSLLQGKYTLTLRPLADYSLDFFPYICYWNCEQTQVVNECVIVAVFGDEKKFVLNCAIGI